MDDPIKVIYKYKNNNKKIQYHIYIYVGDIMSKEVISILEKIKKKNFFDSLLLLSDKEQKIMVKEYGEYWYEKFFNSHHINYTKSGIKKNNAKKKQIIEKYSDDWYTFHFVERDLTARKVTYNYESVIKIDRDRKDIGKKIIIPPDDDEILDYTTRKKTVIDSIISTQKRMSRTKKNNTTDKLMNMETLDKSSEDWYNYNNDISLVKTRHTFREYKASLKDQSILKNMNELSEKLCDITDPHGTTMGTIYQYGGENDDEKNDEKDYDFKDDKMDEELDLEEIEKMYKDVDVMPDENVTQTSKMIKKALKDDKLFDKLDNQLIEFDVSKDELMYDENLKNVYNKIYVKSQYIFKDDTIKIIKSKICCSIKNNKKFDKNAYLIPSRQYLWSEYYYNSNVEQIMIGQKWMKRNELLNIDIEPNQNLRIYESLRGNLKYLKNNIKRYGSKIKREDDEYNILYDYDEYMITNEIFLLDIYNEIGQKYDGSKEDIKNISDIYFKIYFPKIKDEDIKNILNFLNNKDKKFELHMMKNVFDTINNDLVLLNEITKEVELIKKNNIKYKYIFKDNYITQSVIHVILNNLNEPIQKKIEKDKNSLTVKSAKPYTKINLFRIFDNFIIDDEYPFIQYQTPDGNLNFKFNNKNLMDNKEHKDVLAKWFENSPYGISFKVKINERNITKFMAINLHDNGRVEYKTQWKEIDMAKIDDIVNTYDYVKKLIRKINNENTKINIEIPNNENFKFAFVNTIQKFELPEKFVINHNDFSEFSRYFFPYVALVVEPRKRQSKIKKKVVKSKYGTYLRYKRLSKYENQTRIEHRILYFMRNYDYNEKSLAHEISKQFNITEERSIEEILNVKTKYPNIKKSRKILKKLENIPKYKSPGIDIDIQGKQRDKYKIRISGARNRPQLNRIITFMNVLIHLYIETYLYKKPERQQLKTKLKLLTNIAKRRHRVEEIVDHESETKNIKKMTVLDKKRIGFKPEKGQNQWTRSCQNSGDDKKRRPQQYTNETIRNLIKKGYYLNNVTGQYEKKHVITKNGKKKEIIIRTIKLKDLDGTNDIYYGCDPTENGEHMHVGFLTRSNNPFGKCMPCCFKKDHLLSINKGKKDYYLRCIGKINEPEKETNKAIGDKLYILQDTNKIQEGRFGFLPLYLDIFINQILNKKREIINHYLIKSETGYFFKYGVKQDEYQYLNCVATFFDKSIDDIKKSVKSVLSKDKDDLIFTSLNNGDLRTRFETRKNYIKFIENSGLIDYDLINDILSIPGTLHRHGLNIIIFQKKMRIIKATLDKEKMQEDYIILCHNTENVDELYDENKKNILILKENNNYYPIIMVLKKDDVKNVVIKKTFNYQDSGTNIINHIMEYYRLNCSQAILNQMYLGSNMVAKHLYKILVSLNKKEYEPKYQIVDTRNKCIYLITGNGTIIPTKPSGSLYNLGIQESVHKNLMKFDELVKNLTKIYELSKKKIKSKPIGVYIESRNKTSVKIIAVITESQNSVPVKSENYSIAKLKDKKLIIEEKSINDDVDKEISKGGENKIYDQRILSVNKNKYLQESYQLFRLELSEYLKENEQMKNKLDKIINDTKINKNNKRNQIKSFIYKITNKHLYEIFNHIMDNQNGGNKLVHIVDNQNGGNDKLVHIMDKQADIKNYQINNNREICAINATKNICNVHDHCMWSNNQCKFSLTEEMLIDFINKISEELINNDLKKDEVFQFKNYFVSDIVNYNIFTERPNQKIIKSNNNNIKKMLSNIFGKDNIPKIGKRRGHKNVDLNLQDLNLLNQIKDMGDYYIQPVMENNNSIFRAFANCLFWQKNKLYDNNYRNLGYYSALQTDLSNYFKSLVIDWLIDKRNKNEIKNNLYKYVDESKRENFTRNFVVKMGNDTHTLTNCVVEIYVLAKKYKKIIYIFNENNKLIYIFDDVIVFDSNIKKKFDKKYNDPKIKINGLHIKLNFFTSNISPDQIEAIYIKNIS